MDLNKLASTLLSSDAINGLSQRSGASSGDVKKVLSQVLPSLLSGADGQAKNTDTAESFANALAQHAQSNTRDLSGFLGSIDLDDGAKIIGHLLGSNTASTTQSVSQATGVSGSQTSAIMSAAAPLLMSLLGQQADEDDDKDSGVANLMTSLLGNVDVGSLLTGLLTDNDDSGKEESSGGIGSLLGGILGKLLK